jgi:hypothetical protein
MDKIIRQVSTKVKNNVCGFESSGVTDRIQNFCGKSTKTTEDFRLFAEGLKLED